MTMVKKSISVTDAQDAWIKAQLNTGNYGNESEVLRELIRERQEREREQHNSALVDELRLALEAAEKRGFTERTVSEIWAEQRKRRRNRDLEV